MRRFKSQTADPTLTLQQAAIQLAAKKYKKKAPVPPKRMSSFKEQLDGQFVNEEADNDDGDISNSMTSSMVWGGPINKSPSSSEELLSNGSRSRSGSLDKMLDKHHEMSQQFDSHSQEQILTDNVWSAGEGTLGNIDTQSLPLPPPSLLIGLPSQASESNALNSQAYPLSHLRSSLRKTSNSPIVKTNDIDPEDKSDSRPILGRFSTVPKTNVGDKINKNQTAKDLLSESQKQLDRSTSDELAAQNALRSLVGRSSSAAITSPTNSDKNVVASALPRQKSDVPVRSTGHVSPLDATTVRLPTIGADNNANDKKKNSPLSSSQTSKSTSLPDSGIGSLSADLEAGSKMFRDRMLVNNMSTSSEEVLNGGRSLDSSGDSLDFDRVETIEKEKGRKTSAEQSSTESKISKNKLKLPGDVPQKTGVATNNSKLGTDVIKLGNESIKKETSTERLDMSKKGDATVTKQNTKNKGSNPFKFFSSKSSDSSSASKPEKSSNEILSGDKPVVSKVEVSPTGGDTLSATDKGNKPALIGAKPVLPGSKPVLPVQLSARSALHRVDLGKSKADITVDDKPVTKEAILQLSTELAAHLDGLISGSSKHYSVFMQLSDHAMNFHNACASYVDSLPPHGKFQFRELLASLQTVADGLKTCNAGAYEKKVAELRTLAADISTAIKR